MKKTASFIMALIVIVIIIPSHLSADRGLTISKMKSEERIALVIGNGSYQSSVLKNPPNDAEAIASVLMDCGFSVIKKINVDKREMKEAIRLFGDRIRGGGVGLFYFAGHGLQINGTNYLVPINADIQSETEVEYACIAAGFVLGKMHEANNSRNANGPPSYLGSTCFLIMKGLFQKSPFRKLKIQPLLG